MTESPLSPRKSAAVAAILTNTTLEGAARAARVNPRTLNRWLSDDSSFRTELARQRSVVIADVLTGLARASKDAVTVLHVIANSAGAPAASRVQASRAILELARGFEEQNTLATRLAALEAADAVREHKPAWRGRWQ